MLGVYGRESFLAGLNIKMWLFLLGLSDFYLVLRSLYCLYFHLLYQSSWHLLYMIMSSIMTFFVMGCTYEKLRRCTRNMISNLVKKYYCIVLKYLQVYLCASILANSISKTPSTMMKFTIQLPESGIKILSLFLFLEF